MAGSRRSCSWMICWKDLRSGGKSSGGGFSRDFAGPCYLR